MRYNTLMEKPRVLFISHAFPPTVGGVETHNFELSKWLSELTPVTTIANKRGRKNLPFFGFYAVFKIIQLLPKHDVVLLGSGVLGLLGWMVKLFSKKPVICVVHGLDINYNSKSLNVWYESFLVFLYQSLWTKVFLPKLDKFIAVGNETVRVAIKHGISQEKIVFVPNGVDTEKNLTDNKRKDIEIAIGHADLAIEDKKIILTHGRLAKRKGVAWFINNVMPKLSEEFIYVVSGDGPDKQNVINAIEKNNLFNRVIMLGRVSDEHRNILFNTADLFVQPNIKIPGDMEGFGISVIEACACRLPVLASALEGLIDSIKEGKNGFLVEHENVEAYVQKINELFAEGNPREIYGERTRQFIIENYRWDHIAQKYLDEITKTIDKKI